tara:strand:- start:25 stop:1608 length:1584 start_codon:yes stop_codon:yes gene_type:complete
MLWLYIDFPSLQLDCIQAGKAKRTAESHVDSLPALVIVDAKKNCIRQLNESATEQDLRLGMGLAMAASLVDKLCVLPYNMAEEESYLMTLAEQLYSVTANIALFPPHGLALQVDDMLRLYHHLEHYIATIRLVLAPFKLSAYFACGYSPLSAQLLACAGISLLSTDKSKIATAIATLPVECLFISNKAKENMTRLGIKTFAQLQALEVAELATRLDANTMDYLAQLNAKVTKSLVLYQPKHAFEHSVELLYEISTINILLHPIKQLLTVLEAFLKRRDYLCLQIELRLFNRAEGLSHSLQQALLISSAAGEYLAKHWLNLVNLKLTSVKLLAPITKISLSVKQFQANTGEVDDIFLGRRGQLSFAQLASLLVNKLGDEKVLRMQLGNDHRAEFASHYLPFMSHSVISDAVVTPKAIKSKQLNSAKAMYKKATSKHAFSDKLPLRPSFILPEPEPLLSNVSIMHGPERIETAWWEQSAGQYRNNEVNSTISQGHHYQRDYFIAKNAQGQCCWVYREEKNQWYIHGYFS